MQIRPHFKTLSAIVLLGLAAGGCSIQEDITRLDLRLAAVEGTQIRTEQRLSVVDHRLTQADERWDAQEQQLRAQYAEARAEMNGLKTDLARLRGRLEEAEYALGKRLSEVDRTGDQRRGHVERLEAELARGLQRLGAVETYLNLDVPEAALPGAAAPTEAGGPSPADGASNAPAQPPGMPPAAAPAGTPTPPAPEPDPEQLYAAAKRDFDRGAFETARSGFQRLLQRYPKSGSADNAQFWLGEIYYREQWYEKAILEYQKVIENYPKGNKVEASLLKQGLAFFKLGDKANARLILKELIRKHPKSNEAQIARQKVKEMD